MVPHNHVQLYEQYVCCIVVHRIGRKMENEGIEANTYSWSSRYMVKKSPQYTILQYSVQARLSVHSDWISCMYLHICLNSLVFHFVSSSTLVYGLCIVYMYTGSTKRRFLAAGLSYFSLSRYFFPFHYWRLMYCTVQYVYHAWLVPRAPIYHSKPL